MTNLLLHRPTAPINATVDIPGSKSHTNRLLVISALAEGTSVLRNISLGDDSRVLIEALLKLGVKIELAGDVATVHGSGGRRIH